MHKLVILEMLGAVIFGTLGRIKTECTVAEGA